MSEEPETNALEPLGTFIDDQIANERESLVAALDENFDYAKAAGIARCLEALLRARAEVAAYAA